MKILKLALAYIFLMPLATTCFANESETKSDAKDRSSLAVTIYNENLALVKDKRNISFKKGINNIAFIEVSGNIRPETAIVTGKGLAVLEQNFNFDLLTPANILQKAVGSTVKLANVNPATGEEIIEEATILSAVSSPVFKIGNRIETNYPGRILYDSVPQSLRDKPTLVLMVNSENAGLTEMELGYLTGGLGWKADYVAELNDSADTLNLNGWVTLTNRSGVDYQNASLQLVAGDVNIVKEHFRSPAMARGVLMEMDLAVGGMAQESFSDFHLYTLARLTSILSNQTKQVSLLMANSIKTIREYKIADPFNIYNGNSGDFKARNATIYQIFDNKETNNLGMPLPKGVIRVYKSDSKGKLLFAGEDNINHTPKNGEIRLNLGSAFDITADGKQVEFRRISNRSFEGVYEVTVKNPKETATTVVVSQNIPGDWRMINETIKHEKVNSGEVLWKVPVKANGEQSFTFTVLVNQ